MPIRINLLAEAQAAEEMRRRDPIKRAAWAGGILVALIIGYASLVFIQSSRVTSQRKVAEAKWRSIEKAFNEVVANEKEISSQSAKLVALERLSTNRFLWGTILNGLQETVIDDIQMVRIKTDQTYTFVEAIPGKKVGPKTLPGKPAESIEKVTLILDAKDYGNQNDQNINKYKAKLLTYPYFKTAFAGTDSLRLKSLSQPTSDPSDPTHPYSLLTLECILPEAHRNE